MYTICALVHLYEHHSLPRWCRRHAPPSRAVQRLQRRVAPGHRFTRRRLMKVEGGGEEVQDLDPALDPDPNRSNPPQCLNSGEYHQVSDMDHIQI